VFYIVAVQTDPLFANFKADDKRTFTVDCPGIVLIEPEHIIGTVEIEVIDTFFGHFSRIFVVGSIGKVRQFHRLPLYLSQLMKMRIQL